MRKLENDNISSNTLRTILFLNEHFSDINIISRTSSFLIEKRNLKWKQIESLIRYRSKVHEKYLSDKRLF